MKPIQACRWLENKAFAMAPPPDGKPASQDDDDYSTPCWCLKTHDSIGPDGESVELRTCREGRSCFEREW